jgi:hypothetical protein
MKFLLKHSTLQTMNNPSKLNVSTFIFITKQKVGNKDKQAYATLNQSFRVPDVKKESYQTHLYWAFSSVCKKRANSKCCVFYFYSFFHFPIIHIFSRKSSEEVALLCQCKIQLQF